MARPPSATARTTIGAPSSSVTTTVTVENPDEGASSSSSQPQTLTMSLNRKQKKKQVTWKEGTVDNEFMQKKSSKKCCIFHKQKPFDEDDSDSDDHDDRHRHGHGDEACSSKDDDSLNVRP